MQLVSISPQSFQPFYVSISVRRTLHYKVERSKKKESCQKTYSTGLVLSASASQTASTPISSKVASRSSSRISNDGALDTYVRKCLRHRLLDSYIQYATQPEESDRFESVPALQKCIRYSYNHTYFWSKCPR